MERAPRYQLVVVAYKSRQALTPFLHHLGRDIPVILVDNSFHDDDLGDLLATYPNVNHVDAGGNLGYSAASNMGARIATSEFLIFMNPDTRPSVAALDALVDYLDANPSVACCGATGEGTAGGGAQPTALRVFTHSVGLHRRFPRAGIYYEHLGGHRVDAGWISGSCLAIRRRAFAEVGGFDPRYFIYQSDFDLGLRIQQSGRRQVVLGDVVVPHTDGGSSDLPSVWIWQKRGRAWTRFFRNTRTLPAALALSALLLAGYGARALVYAVLGRRTDSLQVWTYFRAGLGEWISPEQPLRGI